MASKVSGVIERIQTGGTSGTIHAIASSAYGYCETPASTAAKTVDMTDFKLYEGVTIHVKFKEKNSAANPTLDVQGTGAKPIVMYGTTATPSNDDTNSWYAGAVLSLTYDGTSWVKSQAVNTNTWRGIENSLTSDSTSVSLSAAQGKVLKGLIDAMDATTPAASGNATAFIDSITQTDGKITSITKKTIPTASTTTAGITTVGASGGAAAYSHGTHVSYGTSTAKIGTAAAGTASTVSRSDHVHAIDLATGDSNGQVKIAGTNVSVKGLDSAAYTPSTDYSYKHITNFNFETVQPLSKYVTFDGANMTNAPTSGYYNGFMTVHNNYLASFILNAHRSTDWYVGYEQYPQGDLTYTAPTWYKLAHSGNVSTGDNNGQIKIAGTNVSVKGLAALAYKASLTADDIPNLSWNKITSDKPDYTTRWPKWNEISQSGAESINEGSSDVTDNTEILTSYASNNGFADTNGKGVVYRRDAIHIYNYINGKLGTMAHETASNYAKLASPALTGTPTAPTAANGTNTTQIATTAFVNNTLAYINAMVFKGTLGTGGTVTSLPASHNAGDTYRVITAGTWAGKYCEVGTLIICVKDGTTAADADWTSVETNEDGTIIGSTPSSSTDNAIVRWDGATGRIVQNSTVTINDNGSVYTERAGEVGYIAKNTTKAHQVEFIVGDSGNGGIYDRTKTKWIVYSDTSGNVILNGNANTATSAGKWTTARTLTIGNKGQSVDGSGNVSWSLADIGALASTTKYAASGSVGGSASSINVTAHTNTTNGSKSYYPLFGTATSGGLTPQGYGGFYLYETVSNGAISKVDLCVGTSNVKGSLTLWNGTKYGNITTVATANRTYTLPDAAGTIALTDGTGASGTWGISITGSAGSVAWANTGHPDTFPPSTHTHYELATIGDKRSENTTPNTYANRIIFQGLKINTVIGSPYTDGYSYLVGLRGWSDSSGGNSHELAFNGNGIYRRQGATTSWGNWFHVLDSNNTYAASTSDVSISWNTSTTIATINGTAIKVKIPANPNTDTNTATATDNILDGSNSGTAITYAPYSGQQAKLSFDVSTTDPTRTDRLNLNGNFHATNLYGDTAVIDNMVTLKYNTTDSALEFVFA